MEEHQTQPQIQEKPLKKPSRTRNTLLYILLALLLTGGAAYGAYAWQRQKINDLQKAHDSTATQPKEQATSETVEQVGTVMFNNEAAPFTFEQPATWSRIHDNPLAVEAPLPNQYSMSIVEPGSVIDENLFGSTIVTKGARIVIDASKTDIKDMNDRFTGIHRSATDRKDKVINGVNAVQYSFSYESDPGVYTDFVHDGVLYSIGFFSDHTKEADHVAYAAYEKLVESFTFKE